MKMECNMRIRNETAEDYEAITAVTIAAFENHPYSHQTEHCIIKALRAAGALTLSLVAESDGEIVGHIAFSAIEISDGSKSWHGLGPISVAPARQKQGIGKALMQEGLSRIRALGSTGCVLVGDPGFYARFGFKSYPQLTHEGVPQQFVLALPFTGKVPCGKAIFHEGFSVSA